MIEKMTRYSFVLMNSDREDFIDRLQTLGVVDIKRSDKPVDEHSQELMDRMEQARTEISEINAGCDAHLTALIEERAELMRSAEDLAHWGEYDIRKASELGLRFYTLSRKAFDYAWKEQFPVEVIDESKDKIWFVTAGGDIEGFPVQPIPSPEKTESEVLEEIEGKTGEINDYREQLESRKSELPQLESMIAGTTVELNAYLAGITAESAAEGTIATYEGYAPETENARLAEEFDKLPVYWAADKAKVEDNPPIKFRNNRFVAMFETLTDMYGRPAYDGFDPTPFISIFFLLFFAFCMGDAAYGLILAAGGLLMKKMKGFAGMAPLVTTLGIATFFVGLLFHTFFSTDMYNWSIIPDAVKKCFLPSKIMGYDGTMVLALAVGVVHICIALITKTVMATKTKGFMGSLGTWGWTLLIVGGVAVAAFAFLGVIDKSATKIITIVLGVVSAIGIFLLNDIHRNPLLNIGSGLWETYNTATGLLGDVLSYLRLYALGLAGSMLGVAFNTIGMMIVGDGGKFYLWIPAVLVLIVGHTLNIAMAALGAFVHPLRLNFLEFFKNSGYEGAGRNYNPLQK